MSSSNDVVRVIVQFTRKEVKTIDRAVERRNQKPANRDTRSDVVRVGALAYAAQVLAASPPVDAPEAPVVNTEGGT